MNAYALLLVPRHHPRPSPLASRPSLHLSICCTGDNPTAPCVWQHARLEHIVAVTTAERQPGGA